MFFPKRKNSVPKPSNMREAREQDWYVTDELYNSYGPDTDIVFGTNTCGTGWFTCWLAKFIQNMTGVNFDNACWFHDAEWGIANKSHGHKIESDSNFEYNLIRCMVNGVTTKKLKLASRFHALVTVNIDHYRS